MLTVLAPQGAVDVLVSPSSPVATGARATSAALTPDGRTLFVVTQVAAQIDAFPLDGNGLPGTAVSSATATSPIDMAIAPGGRVAVVASQSPPLLTSYSIASNGALTQIDIAALPSPPGRVAIDPVGRTVVATAISAGQIVTFPLEIDGQLGASVATVSASGVPRALTFTPDGRFFMTALENQDRLAVYALGVDHTLTLVPPATVDGSATGDRPLGVAVHPGGRFALAAVSAGAGSVGTSGSGSIDVLAIDPTSGALTRSSSLVIGLGPSDILFEPGGRAAYALNRVGRDLSVLRFDVATGGLSSAGAVTLGNRPARLVVRDVNH
ncbi:MAG: beta-propeller fold lactonase family protein [Planctomycetota bacterium]